MITIIKIDDKINNKHNELEVIIKENPLMINIIIYLMSWIGKIREHT